MGESGGGLVSGSPGKETNGRRQRSRGSLQFYPKKTCGRKVKEARVPHTGCLKTFDFRTHTAQAALSQEGARSSLKSPSRAGSKR